MSLVDCEAFNYKKGAIMVSRVICKECGGWLVEDMQTGEMNCDTCKIRILPDGTIDRSDCEEDEE
jgi:DNA-directed RNA polymerase subunit RPC12/RpoP